MKNFTYFRPTTAEQAVALLEGKWGNTEMLAGGTDLLALQKEFIAQPGRVVSLNGIAGLQTISVGERVDQQRGVRCRHRRLHADPQRRLTPPDLGRRRSRGAASAAHGHARQPVPAAAAGACPASIRRAFA